MPICNKCGKTFPNRISIDGKLRTLNRRKYCLECSPFGNHNTKKLEATTGKKKRSNPKAVAKHRKLVKMKAIEYKGGKCCICGYDKYSGALEFHHKNSDDKEFGISERGWTISWEKIKNEIDKCILVCSNCHREIEAGVTEIPKNIL